MYHFWKGQLQDLHRWVVRASDYRAKGRVLDSIVYKKFLIYKFNVFLAYLYTYVIVEL